MPKFIVSRPFQHLFKTPLRIHEFTTHIVDHSAQMECIEVSGAMIDDELNTEQSLIKVASVIGNGGNFSIQDSEFGKVRLRVQTISLADEQGLDF
ncbi:MAG: hypothetical protein AABP62_23210 [Planctomycetota bacterium]